IYTFTSMVRVYNARFLKYLNLKSGTYDINPEIIFKAIILRARVLEIPGHLDWSFQKAAGPGRVSSMRIIRGIFAGLMTGFIFRPYMFFMLIGLGFFAMALYLIGWITAHTFAIYPDIQPDPEMFNSIFSQAVAEAFRQRPHTFAVGGISLLVALQFLAVSFLSLQNKRYFDELFHISTSIRKHQEEL
ncbi:MAG: glycosyltransferase family 2 protein, partial [Bacteroidia bacterium]|nr:glycosyltransferase family 2 protein [Bacteroidia bacterium]